MRCRLCGCSDVEPCINARSGMTCWWIAADLCSFCAVGDMDLLEFIQGAYVAHVLASAIPEFSPEQHDEAAVSYRSACA